MKLLSFSRIVFVISICLGLFCAYNISFAQQQETEIVGGSPNGLCATQYDCPSGCDVAWYYNYITCTGGGSGDLCKADPANHPCGSKTTTCYNYAGAPNIGSGWANNYCD